MPAGFLIRHWKKELQIFHENLMQLQKASNPDAIHDLRVAVKKLRSYSRLYFTLFKKNESGKLFDDTEKLFSVLGRQRNIEISLELLKKFKNEEPVGLLQKQFEFYLQQTQRRSQAALKDYNPENLRNLTIEIEKTDSAIEEELLIKKIVELIRYDIKKIKSDLKHFNNTYHLIRKRLKDIFYWSKILPTEGYFSTSELKDLNIVLDNLGLTQDHEVLIGNLKYYRRTVPSKGSKEHDSVKKIQHSIAQNKEKYLDKAHGMLKDLLKNNR